MYKKLMIYKIKELNVGTKYVYKCLHTA